MCELLSPRHKSVAFMQ